MTVTIEQFESEYKHNEQHAKYDEIRSTLQELFDKEEPVYCLILNNLILAKSLYKMEDTTKKTMKTIMMVSPEPEVITEDMMRYKLPKWSKPNDIGSANWFMNKYASKPSQCNSAYAVLFNNTIVDIVWYRTKEYKTNLLDIIVDTVENKGWTSSGISSHIIWIREKSR